MQINTMTAIAGMSLLALAAQVRAAEQPSVVIDIAGHPVPVLAGGLYERYRSNPPLSVIGKEAPDVDLSWFKTLKKTRLERGFETFSPNFYYKDSSITAVFTADLDRLRALIPAALAQHVQPVQVWPGRGVVALTAYAYHYCDNDSYRELSLAIVTNRPGSPNLGPLSLLGQASSQSFWGYVLKLPVNTELARVRGVVAYNLPKWLTAIEVREDAQAIRFEIADAGTGKPDLIFEGKKLKDLSSEVALVSNSFTNVDQAGQPTYGYAVSRRLKHASSREAQAVSLRLGTGSLSELIRSLKFGKMLRYDYVPEFQSALYAPQPLASLPGGQ